MKKIVCVPVSPLQHNVIDEFLVNVPETQMLVIKPLDGGDANLDAKVIRKFDSDNFLLDFLINYLKTGSVGIIFASIKLLFGSFL